jgi:hypothetical protein
MRNLIKDKVLNLTHDIKKYKQREWLKRQPEQKKKLLATTPKQDKHQQPQQTEKQYQQP